MRLFRKKTFFFFTLPLYTLLLTGALLYYRFPTESVKGFCQAWMEELLPGTSCTIQNLAFHFPPALAVEEMRFTSKGGEAQELASIDHTIIRPDLSSPTSHFQVQMKAGEGNHSFSLVVDADKEQFILEDIQLTGLNLAKLPFLKLNLGRDVTGSLSGTGSYQRGWPINNVPGKGKGSMLISDGSFSLLFPIFSLNSIDLKKMSSELLLDKGSLKMDKGSFNGEELKGEFSGNIVLQSPLKNSPVSFKGSLEPLPPLLKTSQYARDMIKQLRKQKAKATVPYTLSGRMGQPKFKIDS